MQKKQNKNFIKIFFAIIFVASFFVVQNVKAAGNAYYVCGNAGSCNSANGLAIAGSGWSTGNDSNACTSKTNPCLTIMGGIGKMGSGDTLIVGNGIYTNERIENMPSGTAGTYTVIKSENIDGAVIDFSANMANWADTGVKIYGQSYIQIEGFKVVGSSAPNPNGAANHKCRSQSPR